MSYEPGQRVGDYEIQEVLGAGGMGEVYKVRNVISDRMEAMKILLPDLAGQQELAGRFLREIKVLASLDHPNIAQLRTALHIENQLVMIMELVEGTTLAHRLRGGAFPEGEAVECIYQVLAALSYAHARGIVHRDIKPANMMLTRDGIIKLMDFGIARAAGENKLTQTGSTLGSIYYMSPEQVQGSGLDARSDLYSLGVSLYELVTGQHPFEGDTGFTIMKGHIDGVFTPPQQVNPAVSSTLNEIVVMAMAREPESRFQSADAFAKALESIRSGASPRGLAASAASVGAVSSAAATTPTRPAYPSGAARPATSVTPPPPPAATGGVPAPSARMAAAAPPSQTYAGQQGAATSSPALGAVQAPPPQSPSVGMPSSKRAFYIGLGSALTLVFLVLTAMKLPMFHGTPPDSKPAVVTPAPAPVTPVPVTPPPVTTPAADTPPASAAPSSAPATPAPAAKSKPSGPSAAEQKAAAEAAAQAAAEQAAAKAAAEEAARLLDEQEKRFVGMTARYNGMKESFERLSQQQAATGFAPSSALATPYHTMVQYMSRAEAALSAGDGAGAKKYMDLAEPSIEALEKKFGR
jgi:serine/threonine-protein kinase